MPAVSVLMVFHRDTPFLRPAIASVLGQTLRDLELVLVDNGTGLSADALGEPGRDPRLQWVRLARNEGIAAGHNAGVAAARGEFLALLDYDDVMLPDRLDRQCARLRAEPALGLVSSLAETIDETGRVTGREFALVGPEAQRRYSQFAAPVVTPAYTGRREIFTALPYRPEFVVAADFDFLARVAERWPMAAVPEVLLHYRRYAGQTTVQRAVAIAAERCAVRLLTARRRAGRPEGVPPVWGSNQSAGAAALACAECCLDERFPVLAAYHARRSMAERRSPAGLAAGLGIFLRARRAANGDRRLATRMFFTGPVRALDLRPA
jgi:glycosyltransferase involved in cell wall biosynthesis